MARADWSRLILGACENFDVEMVRELLAVGVRADRLYMTIDGDPWDLVSWALQSYYGRSHAFEKAPALWADKCSEIVGMLLAAGGTRLVTVWLGPELAPVLASRFLSGYKVRGSESWPEIQSELGIGDGVCWAGVVLTLLNRPGVLQLAVRQGDPASMRFEAAVDAWFDTFDDGCEPGVQIEG